MPPRDGMPLDVRRVRWRMVGCAGFVAAVCGGDSADSFPCGSAMMDAGAA